MRKIACITGTRAEYGRLYNTLKAIKNHSNLDLKLIVTGMHLSSKFGSTVNEIDFPIAEKVDINFSGDTGLDMANSFGQCVQGMADTFQKIKPDIVLVSCDRWEMLATAIAASFMNIPIAHIAGGLVSGSIDESIRHAITKLAHIHLVKDEKAKERVIKLGEDTWRIFMVGKLSSDLVTNTSIVSKEEIAKKYNLDLTKPIFILIQHPVTTETNQAEQQIKITLDALSDLKQQTMVIYPNADAGGQHIIKTIKQNKKPFMKIFKNLPFKDFLSLMNIATVIIGNSSAALDEAPFFGLPAVNIGSRQTGRERLKNVIDALYDKEKIKEAVNKAMSKEFKKICNSCKNKIVNNQTGQKIADILSNLVIDKKLLQKKITY